MAWNAAGSRYKKKNDKKKQRKTNRAESEQEGNDLLHPGFDVLKQTVAHYVRETRSFDRGWNLARTAIEDSTGQEVAAALFTPAIKKVFKSDSMIQ